MRIVYLTHLQDRIKTIKTRWHWQQRPLSWLVNYQRWIKTIKFFIEKKVKERSTDIAYINL